MDIKIYILISIHGISFSATLISIVNRTALLVSYRPDEMFSIYVIVMVGLRAKGIFLQWLATFLFTNKFRSANQRNMCILKH